VKILKIDAFELPVYAGLDLTQRYEPIGGETILRAVSGRGIKQMTWTRTRITTSGGGWVPSGLESLDFAAQHNIACVVAQTVPADPLTRLAWLLAGSRADAGHEPYGLAQLACGQTVEVGCTVVDGLATVEEVTGAVGYQVGYYPQLMCWVRRPTHSGPEPAWELICEEV